MTAIAAQELEKHSAPHTKSAGYNGRRATDKYWSLLPILLLVIWITTSQDVLGKLLYHNHASGGKFDSHVSEAKDTYKSNDEFYSIFEKELRRCFSKETENARLCRIIMPYDFMRSSDDATGISDKIRGQNWVLDTIACNVDFLNENYERNGSIVIWAKVLFCLCLIAYSLASLSTNNEYRRMIPIVVYKFFLLASLRIELFYVGNLDVTVTYISWILPGLIYMSFLMLFVLPSDSCHEDSGKNNKNKEKAKIRTFIGQIGCVLIMVLPLVFCFQVIVGFSFDVFQSQLDDNFLQYSNVGIICYVFLIYQHFVFMVISCAVSLGQDRNRTFPGVREFLRAWIIVSRYHFGTACYHATIIVPKIKAVLIMNEEDFKAIPIFSTIDRIYMMHWKVHDLSLTMTAARGHDYSKSVRELLQLSTRDSPKPIKNCSGSWSQFFRCCAILTVAICNLVVIGLWAFDVMLDSSSVVQNFQMYLVIMFLICINGKLIDVCRDNEWLYEGEKGSLNKVQTV